MFICITKQKQETLSYMSTALWRTAYCRWHPVQYFQLLFSKQHFMQTHHYCTYWI